MEWMEGWMEPTLPKLSLPMEGQDWKQREKVVSARSDSGGVGGQPLSLAARATANARARRPASALRLTSAPWGG